MLTSVAELCPHLADPAWVVFDCRHDTFDATRGARVYAEGHIPGACFCPVETALAGAKTGTNGRHPLPRVADFTAFLNQNGVTDRTRIVAYDDAGGQYAARLWWLARWIGLEAVSILDGGYPKWIAEGQPVTPDLSPLRGIGTVAARPGVMPVMTVDQIQTGLTGGSLLVLDARAPERFRGETEPIDPVAGRIPGAKNRFFKANLNPDQTFRPGAELRNEFQALLGDLRADQIVHQCGSGITACVNLLAMERAGLAGSKLYVGSWSEWISDPTRPVARG